MSNTLEFLKFPPLNIIDKLRLGGTIFYASKLKNWQRLESIPVEKFLKRLSGKNTFNKMWKPLLRAKLGDAYTKTSAAFIWATIQRMYSARKSGLKKEMFGYMKGGYATILNALVMRLMEQGVDLKSKHAVKSITKDKEGIFTLTFQDGTTGSNDLVINTTPSSFVDKIVPGLPEKELKLHQNIKYLGVICPSVVLKKAISPYYVTNVTENDVPFTGVIEMTALVDPKELKGNHLVYLPKYVSPDDPIHDKSDDDIVAEFKTYLLGMYPHLSESDIITAQVARAKQVFALNTLNYSQGLPPIKSAMEGLFNLNTGHITNGTLNVNETIQLGADFVKKYFS